MVVEALVERFIQPLKHGASAISLLDVRDTVHLQPATLERAGRIAAKLSASGFTEAKVKQVVRALFCTHLLGPREAEQQMERAFDVWDDQHRGVLELSAISHELSALLAGDLELHERQALIEGLGADGSGLLEYEGFREVIRAIGADAPERKGRLAALKLYGEDVGLARTALGPAQAARLSRHELRVAGAVVRVLQREMYRAEDAAALLPALGLPSPSEAQLRAAFKVFDLAGSATALDGEYVREKLGLLVPQAAALVWGSGALGGGGGGELIDLLSFDDFSATLAQLRTALASHALAAGVAVSADEQRSKNWLSQLVSSASHLAIALAALTPSEALLLAPERLVDAGRLISELEALGLSADGCAAFARALHLPHEAEAEREAFLALDLKRSGALPMARLRRVLPALSRHLPPADAESRIAAALADADETQGLEQPEFIQLIGSLSLATEARASGGGVLGDALAGLASIEASTASRLSPLQLQRVGRIARRMQQDGYPPHAVNDIIRVLFISSSRADLERAFALLDRDHSGSLHAGQFRQLLFVAGEHLPEQGMLDEWLAAIDVDASGRLELDEFKKLIRAIRRAITDGHRTTLGTITSSLSATVASVTHAVLEPAFLSSLSVLEKRRAGRVAEALQQAEYSAADVRTITRALFESATEADLRNAFAVFDSDGQGSLDSDEFREMLPLLYGGEEGLSFARVEALFKQADKDRSGLLEYTEFVWLLQNLSAAPAPAPSAATAMVAAGGKSSSIAAAARQRERDLAAAAAAAPVHRYVKSVEELRADRLREAQQAALAQRAGRLRQKAELLARSCALLQQEQPYVCAELLMRLHVTELEEARAVRRADPELPGESADGLLLRGTPTLLERRAEVLLRALASLAVDERDKALQQLRQATRSLDEELPVTETASHGIARSRGLHSRADKTQLVVELLSAAGTQGLPQAAALVAELMGQLKEEAEVLAAAPPALARGSEEQMRAVKVRLGAFSVLALMIENEQTPSAKPHAAALAAKLRADATRVTEFATQGVYVPPAATSLPPIESAESVSTAHKYAPRWGRCRALLVASEKVGQVLRLVRPPARRRSLQEGVQLLVQMEEGDMPTLFTIAKEIVKATDAAGGEEPRTVWWHQIDDGDDDTYAVRDFSAWAATRDLRKARLHLMNNRGADGVAALEKLRQDLLLYARDAG